jgi:SAM-dependent methyltransferase
VPADRGGGRREAGSITPFAASDGRPGENYERSRPGYPRDAVACLVAELGITRDSLVLDLGAGTGKLTRELTATGARVIAAEPVRWQYLKSRRRAPGAHVVAAAAEGLPLVSGSLDVVTVAQAFHWFDTDRALAEIHRVLRPGGHLGLIGYRFDHSVPWVARLSALTNRHRDSRRRRILARVEGAWALAANMAPELTGRRPLYSRSPWPEVFASSALFSAAGQRLFRHEHEVDFETLLRRFGIKKTKLSDEERRRLEAKAQKVVAKLPSPVRLPYLVRFFWYRRCDTSVPIATRRSPELLRPAARTDLV